MVTLRRCERSRPISGVEHADELPTARNREAEQTLDRERISVLLVHRRDIVEPVEIGDVLEVGSRLHQLLGAAMQEADMRVDALDHLAVEFEHQAQNAVRRRMLRAEVDREVAEVRCSVIYGGFAFSSPGSGARLPTGSGNRMRGIPG